MRVNRNERADLVPFWNMDLGDTFFIGDDIYLKISHRNCKPIECGVCDSSTNIHADGGYYAVNLANGEVRDIERNDKFEPCICEVNILKVGIWNDN